MKTIRIILCCLLGSGLFLSFVFGVAIVKGGVGFHYPRVIENEPMRNPSKVLRMEGINLVFADGRVFEVHTGTAESLARALKEGNHEVDVEPRKGALFGVYARQPGWICGTPWAQPIRIPLFPQTVYKNRRQIIAVGEWK